MEGPTNKKNCQMCGGCCKYITVQLHEPTSKSDWDGFFWYLHHENVYLYVDDESDWFVEFKTKCKQLDSENKCSIRDHRPMVCRDHESDECENNNSDSPYKLLFSTADQLKAYLIKEGIDFEFNKLKKISNCESECSAKCIPEESNEKKSSDMGVLSLKTKLKLKDV
ncbi:hypothetical protein HN587_02970 [Candidatus Woesearchaeota archaeon]|jgi:Fe-S-cluster containining protein|nr:hypothetical protein [Candidatus Woesearchaeota archaeon]